MSNGSGVVRSVSNRADFIWSVADLLRGDYKQSEYGKVILPLTVIRRLDCVLESTKSAALKRSSSLKGKVENVEPVLQHVAGRKFYNTSRLDFKKLLDDQNNVTADLRAYIAGFSSKARYVIKKFGFKTQIDRLDKAGLLYKVIARFTDFDFHPDVVSNIKVGYLYKKLIRKFSELSNEAVGAHFTQEKLSS